MIGCAKRVFAGSRFWIFLAAPHAVFAIVAIATDAIVLIPYLNAVLFALSCGVCISFFPAAIAFFEGRGQIARAEALSMGILGSWFALAIGGGWSLVWRFLGQPEWFANNDFVSYYRFVSICSAALHLAAPGALAENIPPLRWVKIGLIAAFAILAAMLIGAALDVFAVHDALSFGRIG